MGARLWWGFIRLFFRLLYHEAAFTYDLVAGLVSLGQWWAWGRTAIPYLRGERVLELAHGPGHLLVTLAERGWSPVGLDLSLQMGRLARRRLRRAGLSLPLVRARAESLPFRDRCFDSLVATFPTEFIFAPETLAEARRVLRPGGRLVVVAGARMVGGNPLARFIRWLYRVTGQDTLLPDGPGAPLQRAGLSVRLVRERVGGSEVVLLLYETEG